MNPRRRLRYTLAAAFALLVTALGTASWLFVDNAGRYIGADYTAFASNLVRGQHETSLLRYQTETLLAHPRPEHREQLLSTLAVIRSREHTTRHGLEQRELDPDAYGPVVAEFDDVNARLPRLESLVDRAVDHPEVHEELDMLAMEVEDTLAFIYSQLHQINHAAAAEQRRMTRWLSIAVVTLGVLVLAIIGVLLWTIDKVVGQKTALERLTVTDSLTGLPNRRAMVQRMEQTLSLAQRNGRPVSLALIDADHFKTINDQDGHPVGDAVLRALAQHLGQQVRQTDLLARIGGEEFGLLMPETDEHGAHELCERLRDSVESLPLPVIRSGPTLTVSIGVATGHPDRGINFNTLYLKADQALYAAKHAGRNRVVSQP
ncbi:GGDEF domain-containing protein [Aquisalimonas asiatica]|uniref:diguanylate cyclase n=1 Tax=Aquisalimonas asiatica TaxID=406100 RepID=A0A1H8V7A9_9GAMM|nr:GGDEF domain-containing protein [Aquisalimonas asiatica]SEP11241.1 diguanylate cyclase (GGDEF) domain-containing protein [Aquisalimonas asiatica]